ncbi:MAG: alpha/beta fold hydrolase [Burkholderiales bacterium]|nr:alpha/beta fold hydrolase [Burkholderiales bacterium]
MDNTLRFTRVASGARIAWGCSGRGPVLVRVAHWMTHVEHDLQSPIWRPWLQRLGRAVQVLRYDERGCGLSGHDTVALGLEAAVEELSAVIDACGADRVALLGQSGAAAPAIAYAVAHPERVSHLVLLGGYLCGLLHLNPSPQALAYHEAQVQLMALGWGRDDPAVQQFFTTTMIPDATPEQARALNEQQRLSCDGARAAAILRARVALDVRALAPQVRVPTLVLHSRGDRVVALERGRELAAAIPGAQFAELPTRNHIPLPGDEGFEPLCDAVTTFVRGSAPGPALTPRERELAALVAQGLDNAQLAAQLGVADKTVRNALSALYAKLGVDGRPQAIARIRDTGLG